MAFRMEHSASVLFAGVYDVVYGTRYRIPYEVSYTGTLYRNFCLYGCSR